MRDLEREVWVAERRKCSFAKTGGKVSESQAGKEVSVNLLYVSLRV